MTFSRTNVVLAVALLITAGLAAGINVDLTRPNYEFLPEMKRSPAYDAFSQNPNFANHRTLQTPVPGTIARGTLPLHFAPTKEDALRAGEQLSNPYADDFALLQIQADVSIAEPTPDAPPAESGLGAENPEHDRGQSEQEARRKAAQKRISDSLSRGREIYRVFCISCHGPTGAGDGPVAKRGFPPPPPLTTGRSAQMKDGQLFHILTYGQGSMPPMAAQLTRDRRWDVINFVRAMQKNAADTTAPATAETPTAEPADSPGSRAGQEEAK